MILARLTACFAFHFAAGAALFMSKSLHKYNPVSDKAVLKKECKCSDTQGYIFLDFAMTFHLVFGGVIHDSVLALYRKS